MLAKNENRVNRYNTVFEILQAETTSFKKLINKEIKDIHVVWELNDNSWYSDEAVVFTIEDVQLGINNWYTNTIDISWNAYAIDDLIHEFDYGYNFSLKWKNDFDILSCLKGEVIKDIQIEEYYWKGKVLMSKAHPDTVGKELSEWILSGVRIETTNHTVCVFNNMDENGLAVDSQRDAVQFRYTKIESSI